MPVFIQSNTIDTEDFLSDGTFENSIVREGLQAYYDTNVYASWPNSGTTWYNIAHNHSHLTVQGGLGTSTFNGVKGWNFNFDGGYINGTYQGSQPSSNATFEAWIYAGASEVTSGDRGTVILLSGNCSQYMSWNKSNGYLSTYWYCSSANGYHESIGPTSRRAWTHWCTVWDYKSGRLYQYVNGLAVGVVTTNQTGTSGTNLNIGRESSGRQFSGSISEVRIYNRALHPHEVMQNYLAGREKYDGIRKGLRAWIDLGNNQSYPGSGSQIFDLSGYSQTVNLYNTYSYNSSNEGSIDFDGVGGMGIFNGGNSAANNFAWSQDGSIGNSAITIEMWVKSSDTGGRFFSKPWNGSGQYNYWIVPDQWYITAGSTGNSINFGRNISNNTWTHVVCWISPTEFGYYLNGGEYSGSATHGVTGAAPSSGNAQVPAALFTLYPYGTWGGNTGFSIDGFMASCKFYNRVLSGDEVAQAFRTQKARFGL